MDSASQFSPVLLVSSNLSYAVQFNLLTGRLLQCEEQESEPELS